MPKGEDKEKSGTTRRQEEIILTLLSTRTVKDAAEKLKIGERQVYRHLGDPDFAKAYTAARKLAFANSVTQLAPLAADAIEALRGALTAPDIGVRVRAAKVILDKAFDSIALADLAAEVQEMKAMQADARSGKPLDPKSEAYWQEVYREMDRNGWNELRVLKAEKAAQLEAEAKAKVEAETGRPAADGSDATAGPPPLFTDSPEGDRP